MPRYYKMPLYICMFQRHHFRKISSNRRNRIMSNLQSQGNEPSKLWNFSFILGLIMNTFSIASNQMVQPFIAKYAISMGAPLTLAATIAGLISIAALVFRPISGILSDRMSRKILIICSNALTALCMYLYIVAPNVGSLIVVRILHGIAFSFSGVSLMAFNSYFIPKDRLASGMGYISMGTIIAGSLGPMLGLWLAERISYTAAFLAAGLACIFTIVIVLMLHYEYVPTPPEQRVKFSINSFISMRLLPYAIVLGLISCGNGLVSTFIALLGDERGIPNVALFFTVYSIVMIACRPFVGNLQDKRGIKIILYPALVILAISMFVLGRATTIAAVLVAAALKAIGGGSGAPAIQAYSLKVLGKDKAGVVSSTCYIGQDIGNAIAPTVGGFLVDAHGYEYMFNTYALSLIVVGGGLFYLKLKYDKKKYGQEIV